MSPYQSFVFIEREPLKAVADHNTRFSLIIPGIQRDSSIISASPPLCTKFSEEPQFSGRHPQSMRFSESSVATGHSYIRKVVCSLITFLLWGLSIWYHEF